MKFKFTATAIVLCMVSLTFAARVPLSDVQKRKDNKNAISLYQPWATISGGIIDTAGLHNDQKVALHDMVHNGPEAFGLRWRNADTLDTFPGNAEAFDSLSIINALAYRQRLLSLNPNIILIGEVRFYDAPPTYYPPNSPYWKRLSNGEYDSSGYFPYLKLNYASTAFQQHCARQINALLETGVVDGIFLDWATNNYLSFFQGIRTIIGNDAVIIGNTNHNVGSIEQILPFLNGIYMECWWGSGSTWTQAYYMDRVRRTIINAERDLKMPKLIATEMWSQPTLPDLDSISTPGMIKLDQAQMPLMRAGVAAHYTLTNGYYSFYPKTFKTVYLVEHMHVYDDFLNANLGKPTTTPATQISSAFSKEWENGTVVYNPPSASGAVTVTFSEQRRSQATGKVAASHTVPKGDGDIFLKGDYPQLYPAPAGFPSTGLPALRPLPDTTYKDQFVSVSPVKSRVVPRAKSIKISTIVKNQQILIRKEVAGASTKYYNTAGRQIKVQPAPKK